MADASIILLLMSFLDLRAYSETLLRDAAFWTSHLYETVAASTSVTHKLHLFPNCVIMRLRSRNLEFCSGLSGGAFLSNALASLKNPQADIH
eukprot:IDg16058t1